MHLVERHVIKRVDPRFTAIDAAAFASKHLYNAANYAVRQSFIHEGVYLNYNYYEMHRRMKDHEAYQALPAKVAQWVLRVLDKNWQSFFEALSAWQADSSKFLGRPKLPGYKDKQKGRNLLVYTTPRRRSASRRCARACSRPPCWASPSRPSSKTFSRCGLCRAVISTSWRSSTSMCRFRRR